MQASFSHPPRRASVLAQAISVLVTVAMVTLALRPLAASAQPGTVARGVRVSALPAAPVTSPSAVLDADERHARALARLKELASSARGLSPQQRLELVREQVRQLEGLEPAVEASFASVARMLEERRLAGELLERHRAAEGVYRQRQAELKRLLQRFKGADAAADEAARQQGLEALATFLAAQKTGPRHKKLNPDKLPWRVQDGKVRKPALTREAFPVDEARTSTASTALAPTPADLAETDDAQLTQPIRDLAASLGHHPVRLYNWVRNNIEYIPSFGSIQGSDVTLSKRRGNAFDTASLLVALYRASGIPARYVYGTLQVPTAAAMNWVGGVTTPEAAQQLWAQGGVPNTRLVSGGKVTHLVLEHVWVEAWVDFVPSRGQKHVQGDTWVSLDPSFKQYTHTQGLLADAALPLDVEGLRSSFLTGATVNDAQGWIQDANFPAIQAASDQYVGDLRNYVQLMKPDATNAEVFGGRTVVKAEPEVLAASLPNPALAVGARYSDLPSSLTHQFRYQLFADELDAGSGGPMLSFVESLPRLAGRRVSLTWVPATQADADLMASVLPRPLADGTQPTAEQYAAVRFPAYLLRLKPELRVDGVLRASGQPVTMGTELPASGAFTGLDLASGWDETSDLLVAGQATVIGLNLHGIDRRQLLALKARMQEAKARIEARDLSQVKGEAVGGDMLAMTIWSYFATVDRAGSATRASSNVIDLPALSFGLAHVDLDVTYSFGVARSARSSGILLDIGHLRSIRWARDGNPATWLQYNRLIGQFTSAMEHQIPEQLFVRPEAPGEAVSAVRLLAKAAMAGQRVYTLTQANLAAVLPQLSQLSSEVLDDIRAAVAVGKEVVVHEKPVTVFDWSGAGYMVLDPRTGAGAYLISGGANGGKLIAAYLGFINGLATGIFVTMGISALIAGTLALGPFLVMVAALALLLFVHSLILAAVTDEETYACYAGAAATGFNLALIWAPLARWVQVVANLAGWGLIAGSAAYQCFD